MENRQIDKKLFKQVLLENELHRQLKIRAAEQKNTIKTLIEVLVIDFLGKKKE